jgi:hypothetical protein
MKRVVVPAAVVAAVFIAAAWWFALSRGLPSVELAPEAATASAPAASPSPASRPQVVDAGAQRAVPFRASRPSPVRDRIRDATDLRALYEKMKDETDRTGEASYRLAEAIFECSAFVDVPYENLSRRLALAQKAIDNPRREEVLTFMFERCKGFSGNPAAMQEMIQAMHKRAEAAAYPAETARGLRYEPGRRDPQGADKTAITLLSANIDPDVVHELAQYVNVRNQGAPAYRNVDAATRQIAWGLLECDYGADCGPRSRSVMMTCVALGACDLQRVEEAILVQGSQAVFNKAAYMRDALAREIAARDWNGVGFAPRFPDSPGANP